MCIAHTRTEAQSPCFLVSWPIHAFSYFNRFFSCISAHILFRTTRDVDVRAHAVTGQRSMADDCCAMGRYNAFTTCSVYEYASRNDIFAVVIEFERHIARDVRCELD